MTSWRHQLRQFLDERQVEHLLRSPQRCDRCARKIHRDNRRLINLASNDYLALAQHSHLVRAATEAAHRFGVGAGASALISGRLELHHQLEHRFAEYKHAEAALLLPTGYMANLALLGTLSARGDLVCIDKLNHASLIDAARAGGAVVRVFPHRHYDKLRRLLDRYGNARRRLIVTDAVFSMDGDCADLPALCALRDEFDAMLIVDEAHATGVLGERGAGLAEYQGVNGCIDVTVSTCGKALGGLGGVVTAERLVIDTLINAARPYIYTTAPPPTQVAVIDAALDILRSEPQRRQRLAELGERFRAALRQRDWAVAADPTPIIPLIVGDAERALRFSDHLAEAGFLAPAIRPPTVAPGASRVRISLRSDLEDDDLDRLLEAIDTFAGG